jgi:hypothetical protein
MTPKIFVKLLKLTADGGRDSVPWQRIELFSAVAIEGHIEHGGRIPNVVSLWDDEEVVVAVER